MEITKREVIASIGIVSLMLILGLFIGSAISNHQMDQNQKYYEATHINTKQLFQYGLDTSVGDAFVYGTLIAKDPVTYPGIKEKYLSIEKVKEQYTMHTRVVSDGKGHSHTETYYTWDEIDRESKEAKQVTFLGIKFKTSQLNIPSKDYICTQYENIDLRDKFYGYATKSTGTIFATLKNGDIGKKDVPFYHNMTIEQAIDKLTSNAYIYIFWILWLVLTALCVYGFYYLNNNWLNK